MSSPSFASPWLLQTGPYPVDEVFRFGSLMMSGNGYLGFRGTFPSAGSKEYAACVVSDTYDCADGKWKELCTVPNGLFIEINDGSSSPMIVPTEGGFHALDFRYGETSGAMKSPDGKLEISFTRFASYAHLHLICQRVVLRAAENCSGRLRLGIDGDTWSLNGDHFRSRNYKRDGGRLTADLRTSEEGKPLVVASVSRADVEFSASESSSGIFDEARFTLQAGEALIVEQFMSVYSANDLSDPYRAAIEELTGVFERGYDEEFKAHKGHWDDLWERYDILLDGDEELQSLVRYNTYHNVISTPAHTDRLPIGARGLSCQAYQGAAFWDQEIFNLPMYIYTDPKVAERIISYRHATLPGAQEKAKRLGYEGAYYAWISGDSGEELCPDYFFIDVLSGRKIRNHFNDWQIHISPDITYALWEYYRASGDDEFLYSKGAEIAFSVAQFLYSRIHYSPARDRYEILRVLGPDEYHENADNNAFTNYQARFALATAVWIYRRMEQAARDELENLSADLGLSPERIDAWDEMQRKLYLPSPDPENLLIEQFDGFFQLEDILPEELAGRLQDEQEYWGWPNGIAYETQVSKQADVVQLFALHPFPNEVVAANYDYYEPRSQHRSSLSPGVHALVAAKSGNLEQAERYLRKSLKIDIANTHPPESGGTFIGGIHTAACGIAWQIVVKGFLGMELDLEELRFSPLLPTTVNAISLKLRIRGQELGLSLTSEDFRIESAPGSAEELSIRVSDQVSVLKPGEMLRFTPET